MNPGFAEFLRATPQDRRDVFLSAAARLGTPEQNVEKDFWVTWTLDVLFNGLPVGHPRFLFKGGTSLSKAYGLISRFSEDIDITVFREDLGQAATVAQLEALSRVAICGKIAGPQPGLAGPPQPAVNATHRRSLRSALLRSRFSQDA